MDWNSIAPTIFSLLGSTILSTAVTLVIKKAIETKLSKWTKDQEDLVALRTKEAQDTQNKVITDAITTVIEPINNKLDSIQKKVENNTSGTVMLIRENLKKARDQHVKEGYISSTDYANWSEQYNVYKELGGNHFKEYMNAWHDDIELLPREPKKRSKSK